LKRSAQKLAVFCIQGRHDDKNDHFVGIREVIEDIRDDKLDPSKSSSSSKMTNRENFPSDDFRDDDVTKK
jgi:hypothetical protein